VRHTNVKKTPVTEETYVHATRDYESCKRDLEKGAAFNAKRDLNTCEKRTMKENYERDLEKGAAYETYILKKDQYQ